MEMLIGLILGLIIGTLSRSMIMKKKYKRGEFILDMNDIDKDVFTISMDTFKDIEKMKWIMLKVKNM